jgi:hypothetical protein
MRNDADRTLEAFLDDLWSWKARYELGLAEKKSVQTKGYFENVFNIQFRWFPVVRKLFYRLVMGGMRYGMIGSRNKPQYARVEDIQRRVGCYQETGNLEYLLDAANLCCLEYLEPSHPLQHEKALDDGEHSKEK